MLLLVAGLVIFTHSVIPHDHHYDVACDTEQHEEHSSQSDSPMHCHFLNDIVFDDAIISLHQTDVEIMPLLFTFLFDIQFHIDNHQGNDLPNIETDHLPKEVDLISHMPTRGSPKQLV